MRRNQSHLQPSQSRTSVFGNTTFSGCGRWVRIWSVMLIIVTLVIVCVIAVVALIILIGLVVFTKKHCANKRKRLEGSLVQNDAAAVFCVCVNYNMPFHVFPSTSSTIWTLKMITSQLLSL